MLDRKGVFGTTVYLFGWIFKAVILSVILTIIVSDFNRYIDRDYDIRALEASAVKDRMRYCLDQVPLEDINTCMDSTHASVKIMPTTTLLDEPPVINDQLYVYKPYCVYDTQFRCSEDFIVVDGELYDLDIVVETPGASVT